jgi:hypothetical protein
MQKIEILNFLKSEIEPLPDNISGNRYRASVHLLDGTYLPCVVFQSKIKRVELALKRFEQLKNKPDQYRIVVESFVASGSCLADYDVLSIEPSPFAWSRDILKMIHGETTMAWTAFVVEMDDGKRFSYGTSFNMKFFDLPIGYNFSRIRNIFSGMVHSDTEGTRPFTLENHKATRYLREKPFFTCYLDGIDS